MTDVVRRRLGSARRVTVRTESFLRAALPRCDAVVASLALHHVRTRTEKLALYRRIHAALRPGGRLVIVDCQPAADPETRRAQFADWTAHLRESYSARKAAQFLAACREIEAVARAEGVPVAADVVDRIGPYLDGIPGSMRPSLLIDLQAGRRIEVEALQGAVVRRAAKLGVQAPIMSTLYSVLRVHASGETG